MTSLQQNHVQTREKPVPPLLRNRLLTPLTRWRARRLLRQGDEIRRTSPERLSDAIRRVEKSFALQPAPGTALLLASLLDRANRSRDAVEVLLAAFRADPGHPTVRLQAAEAVLRHGVPEEVDAFFAGVLAVDPRDAFALFVSGLLAEYDALSDRLVEEVETSKAGGPAFIVALPVWGQPFSEQCVRFALASLLSPNNLPALARTHSVIVAVFTDDRTAVFLEADPLFGKLRTQARVRIFSYGDRRTAYREVMQAHYGQQTLLHSSELLSSYYARTCKFLLMSCAHYVALHAARRTDARVFCDVADLTLTDGSLPRIAELLDEEADAVLLHSIQLPGKVLRPQLDRQFRQADGVVSIAPEAGERVLGEHVPPQNFHGAESPYDMPLRVCWRVGADGLLVHANHYHPVGLRPAKFDHPLRLTTDPIDSRFLDRTSLSQERVHLSSDSRILCISVDDDPLFEASSRPAEPLTAEQFALWLWQYWGRLRGFLFRNPIRLGRASAEEWREVEAQARLSVEDVVSRIQMLEEAEALGRPPRLTHPQPGCSSTPSMPKGGRVRE